MAPFDSHGRCPVLFGRPPPRLPGVVFLERTSRANCRQVWPRCPQTPQPVESGPSSDRKRGASTAPAAARLKTELPSSVSSVHSTPPSFLEAIWSCFLKAIRAIWFVFAFRQRPEFGTKRPASAASTGWRSVHSGTLQEATGGTQTHSRRTVSKLGRLQRARQGLV